jgi:hypothetical protein
LITRIKKLLTIDTGKVSFIRCRTVAYRRRARNIAVPGWRGPAADWQDLNARKVQIAAWKSVQNICRECHGIVGDLCRGCYLLVQHRKQ